MSSPDRDEPTSAIEFDKLQEVLENSSSRNTRLLVTFVLFLLYILVTVAATTDLQLLLPESKVMLPLLRVELNLFGFFLVAPALILILHFNLLLNLLQHARKLKAWNEKATKPQQALLPAFFFNYSVSFKERTINYFLLRALLAGVLCFFPVYMLMFIQDRFAAYHSVSMTAGHFGLVLLDLFVLLVYWLRINYPQLLDENYDSFKSLFGFYWREPSLWRILIEARRQFKRSIAHASRLKKFLRFFFRPVTIIKYNILAWKNFKPRRVINPIYNLLFGYILLASAACLLVVYMVTIDYFDDYQIFIPRLDVSGKVLVKTPPSDIILHAYLTQGQSADSAWAHHAEGIDLRGRDLRFVRMEKTKIWNGRLSKAFLNGAYLYRTELNGVDFSGAQLNGVDFSFAQWTGADLREAKLNRAILGSAQLNGAILRAADLNGAYLCYAQLNGANLRYANLNCADLERSELNGADLRKAKLNGANLLNAELNGADLDSAELNGANLRYAQLNGAILFSAKLIGADLRYAQLNGADLEVAKLEGANIGRVQFAGTYMERTMMRRVEGLLLDDRTIYFQTSIRSSFSVWLNGRDWIDLRQDSASIQGAFNSDYLWRMYCSRLDKAEIRANSDDSLWLDFQPDSAGFVAARIELACKSTYIGHGLLKQHLDSLTGFMPQTGEELLEHMCLNCPDSLEVILERADKRLKPKIEDFLGRKSADEKQ